MTCKADSNGNIVIDSNDNILHLINYSSSYNGKIRGIPTEGGLGSASYSDANKRPFYIIVISSGENVNFVKTKIAKKIHSINIQIRTGQRIEGDL